MPFESLTFRFPWRPYQARVLEALEQHLGDNRLHVVAAPGAGKTTLGLEIFRRLKKRTLILSPTRVIRDQWIHRLGDFVNADVSELAWVSKRLDSPGVLTSVTYQALHAQSAGEESAELEDEQVEDDAELGIVDPDNLAKRLQAGKIELLILDEAHHLRAEWWRVLDKVCIALPGIRLVSLTATPPYDSTEHEWAKYEQLCGPIDEEISVPELVKAGTLCPHQDYIWAVSASPAEKERIREYDNRVSALCNALFIDDRLNRVVLAHPWLSELVMLQDVAKEPRIAVALLAFLKARDIPMPTGLCKILDLTPEDVPELGRHWWQILLEAVLFSDTFKHGQDDQEYVDQLKKQLRASELLRNQELSLERSRRLDRSLSLSIAKVDACIGIHKLEYRHRKESLRQVILTDYIRDEHYGNNQAHGAVNFGAWPVFCGLVAASKVPDRIALLTGRISVIHQSLLDKLLEKVERERFSISAVESLAQYCIVSGPLNQLTAAFTALLLQGEIKTLVGTRALLGEGWDAPAVNSLVLGSVVGSFMLTNQMRGRAIRIDRNVPDKVSSVWHIVALDTNSQSGLNDYLDLKKRFDTFVGLSVKNDTIESGFARMRAWGLANADRPETEQQAVPTNNWQMIRRYRKRAALASRWHSALTLNAAARVLPSVTSQDVPGIRTYHFKNTLTHLLIQLGAAISSALFYMMHTRQKDLHSLFLLLALGMVGALLYRLPKTIAVARIGLKHLPVDGALKQIGLALAESLCQTGLITTSFRRLKVQTVNNGDGTFHLALQGGTFYESSLFADAFAEILAPIDNPRYLVIREGKVFGLKRDDYHAVPLQLGLKKEMAQVFFKAWCKYVGPTELIYTRSEEGRERMVKAKMRAFSAVFANQVKRQDRWQ